MKRIVLLATVTVVVAAMIAASALSANAQEPGEPDLCAPWSKEWDISEGWWWFQWYRWCHNPSVEEEWVVEWDGWDWWAPVEVD